MPIRTCATCAWLTASQPTRCLMRAPEAELGPLTSPTDPACARWEPPTDCATCGACCREAFDSVPVTASDPQISTKHPHMLRVHDDGWTDLQRTPSPTGQGTRCAALRGDGQRQPFRCAIYADRTTACRELERDSVNCLFARRRVGLSPDPR